MPAILHVPDHRVSPIGLELRGLVHRWPGQRESALSIDTFSIPPGQAVAIVGPSGSGKTSLLQLLAGLLPVQAGSVRWGTTELATLGEPGRDAWRRRQAGLVLQDIHLLGGLSAVANVLAPCWFTQFRTTAAQRRRARTLLGECGVPAEARDVLTLSRGEQQRTGIARALFAAPPLLLADEPTASLDAATAAAVTGLLLEAAARLPATLLLVTHDMAVACRMHAIYRLQGTRLTSDVA